MTIRAVPAVTRAVAILRLLGRGETPLGMKAIAQALDLVPSTACTSCARWWQRSWSRSIRHQALQPRRRHAVAGARALESADFPSAVQPHLDELSRRYGVTAIGVELPDLQHMIVVALSRSQAPVRLHVDIGSRFPALISATGRCVAAFSDYPPDEIEKRFRALRWDNAPSYETWRKEVETVRRQGFSIDRGNYIAGVTIVAVPVLERRRTITHTHRLGRPLQPARPRRRRSRWRKTCRRAARAAGQGTAIAR